MTLRLPIACRIHHVLALSLAISGVLAILSGQASAQNAPAKPAKAKGAASPVFETLQPGKQIINRQVLRGGKPIGTIADLAMDVETEQLALAIIAPSEKDKETFLAIPAAILVFDGEQAQVSKEVTDAMVAAARRFALRTTKITRKWAAEEFALYKRDPYWAAFRDRRKQEYPDRKFDEEAPELTLYSQLVKTSVVDEKDRAIGTIADFAFDTKPSSIAYAAYDASGADDGLRAIPLGAFETMGPARPDKAWQIRLPEASITKFKPFDAASAWPKELERGWVEYIAHRYGRGGVQTEKKE